jgi:phosphopantothenoylcysteine synthetase/decarboxylase
VSFFVDKKKMESKLLKKIIKNQRIIMKKQRKTDGRCNQIELRQNTLYRNIMRGNYNLMEIAVEEMKKVDLFYSGLIKKYRMKDLSASSEQCKRMIKSEIKYGEVSKHTQELKVNMKIIDGFFGADFSGVVEPGEENDPEKNMEDDLEKDVEDPEKNMEDEDGESYDLEKDLEDCIDNYGLQQTKFIGFDLLGSCGIDHLDFFQMGLPELDFNSHVSFNMP